MILTAEDGRQFRLSDKEFSMFEDIFEECELVEPLDFSGISIVKTDPPTRR